jgi:hypothetical protein
MPATPASATRALSVVRAGLSFPLALAFGTEAATMPIRVALTIRAAVVPAVAGPVAIATAAPELL